MGNVFYSLCCKYSIIYKCIWCTVLNFGLTLLQAEMLVRRRVSYYTYYKRSTCVFLYYSMFNWQYCWDFEDINNGNLTFYTNFIRESILNNGHLWRNNEAVIYPRFRPIVDHADPCKQSHICKKKSEPSCANFLGSSPGPF